jgi:hypothetical protein
MSMDMGCEMEGFGGQLVAEEIWEGRSGMRSCEGRGGLERCFQNKKWCKGIVGCGDFQRADGSAT